MRALKATPLSNLPKYRICSEYAFQIAGIDYAGPLFVKNMYNSNDSGELFKCYVLLITCATTRGVHLELTPDMSTPALILALQRFICRKAYPEKFVSDNGKSFKSEKLKRFLRKNHIKWEFILELSPWMGGFYERLIKVVKSAIRKTLSNAKLNYDELSTVVVEVESMVNSRPLTYLSDENMEVLTPYHLLHGRNISVRGQHVVRQYCSNEKSGKIENRARYVMSLINRYWQRFYKEYTTELRERMQYDKQRRETTTISPGEVVIIKEEKVKPMHWKKGVVEEVIIGRDDAIRGVKLRTTSSKGKVVKINRSLKHIIPLELDKSDYPKSDDIDPVVSGEC